MEEAPIKFLPQSLDLKDKNITLDVVTDFQPNMLDRPFYPSDKILCQFSNIAYKNLKGIEEDMDIMPQGWKLVIAGKQKSVLSGYFGAAFWHEENQHFVICHKGTDSMRNMSTNVKGVALNNYSSEVHLACTFTFEALSKLGTNPFSGCSISITGHSLGGWLAQVTTFVTEYFTVEGQIIRKLRKNEKKYHPHCVTFDNPGCYDMLRKISKDYFAKFEENIKGERISELDVTAYFLVPNKINTFNEHAGHLKCFGFEIREADFTKYGYFVNKIFDDNTANYHKLKHFLEAFENCDETVTYKILDWPETSLTNFKQYNKYFELVKNKRNFHPNLSDLNVNYIAVSYKSEIYDTSVSKINIFHDNEIKFLRNWKKLQAGLKTMKIDEFLTENNLDSFRDFLPGFDLDLERHIFRSANCLKLVNRIKWIFLLLGPQVQKAMKDDISHIPEIFEGMYKTAMHGYTQKLPKYECSFKDNIGLGDFLNRLNNESRILVLKAKETKDEVFRLLSILKILVEYQGKYFLTSLNDIGYLENYLDVIRIFQSNTTEIDKIFIIDFEDSNDVEIIKGFQKAILEAPNIDKKVICIVPEGIELIDVPNSVGITIKNALMTFKDLSDADQESVLSTPIICINSKEYAVGDFLKDKDVAFDTVKNHFLNHPEIATFEFRNENFNSVFSNCFCLKVGKRERKLKLKNFEPISESIFQNQSCNIKFFVLKNSERGNEFFNIIPNELIIEGEEKEFYKKCLENFESTVFKLRVTEELIEWLEVFDSNLYRTRSFYSEIILHKQRLLDFLKNIKQVNSCCIFIRKNSSDLFSQAEYGKLKSHGIIKEVKTLEEGYSTFESMKNVQQIYLIVENDQKEFILENYKGKLDDIRHFAKINEAKWKNENELLSNNKIVLISNEPGMGKSSTFLKLAISIDKGWAFRIDLKEAYRFIQLESVVDIECDSVIRFLLDLSGNSSELMRILLKYSLEEETSVPIYIFFDAFDEIQDQGNEEKKKKAYIQQKVIQIIKFLVYKTKARVCVSTRVHASQILESEFNIFSTKFKEIDDEEQRQYLGKIWSLRNSFTENWGKNKLDGYAKKILEQLNNEGIQSFMGIPLQLRMIGEVFQSKKTENLSAIPYNRNLNLYFLYKGFVDRKFDIYSIEKNPNFIPDEQSKRNSLHENHEIISTRFLFLSYDIFTLPSLSSQQELEINRVGLVEISLRSVQFVHRTFAEYFSAHKVIDKMKNPSDEFFQKFLIEKIFSKSEFKVFRRFINDICLAKNIPSEIFKFLGNSSVSVCDRYDEQSAAGESNKQDMGSDIRSGNDHRHCCPHLYILHNFVQDNCLKLTEMMLECFESRWLDVKLINEQTVLHVAIENSFTDIALTILKYENDLNAKDYLGNTPLHLSAGKRDLNMISVKLIELGANPCTENDHGYYPLSEAARNKNWNLFSEIMEKHPKNVKDYFTFKNNERHSGLILFLLAVEDNQADIALRLLKNNLQNSLDCIDDLRPQLQHLIPCIDNLRIEIQYHIDRTLDHRRELHLHRRELHLNRRELHDLFSRLNHLTNSIGDLLSHIHHLTDSIDDPHPRLHHLIRCIDDLLPQLHHLTDYIDDPHLRSHNLIYCIHDLLPQLHQLTDSIDDPRPRKHYFTDCIGDPYSRLHHLIDYIDKLRHRSNIVKVLPIKDYGNWDYFKFLYKHGTYIKIHDFSQDFKEEEYNKIEYLLSNYIQNRTSVLQLIDREDIKTEGEFQENLLRFASTQGQIKVVTKLIDKNTNLNATDERKRTALHLAVENNQWEVTELLLQNNAHVNVLDYESRTPLLLAAEKGNWELLIHMIDLIIKQLKNSSQNWNLLNSEKKEIHPFSFANKNGENILHKACEKNQLNIAVKLIENGADFNALTEKGDTALYLAAKYGYWNLVSELAKKLGGRGNGFYKNDKTKETIFHLTERQNLTDVAINLMDAGLDPNMYESAYSPLCRHIDMRMSPYRRQNWDFIFALVKHGATGSLSESLFDVPDLIRMAIKHNQIEVILKLIDKKLTKIDYADLDGNTLLLIAGNEGRWEIVSELLNLNADPKIPNKNKVTILHLACRDNQTAIVSRLIDAGSNLNEEDYFGKTPLYVAAEKGHWDVIFLLIDKGGHAGSKTDPLFQMAKRNNCEMRLRLILDPP